MNTAIDRMFEQAYRIPSIPKSLQTIIESLNREDTSTGELVDALAMDPALAGKVLRMANTAHFGLPKQVSTLDEAVGLIGFNSVRTIALSSGLISSFEKVPNIDLNKFWLKTLTASQIIKRIARSSNINSELASTATLMHGIGILLIHQVFPDIARIIQNDCEHDSPRMRVKNERMQLGFTHCEVGQKITNSWKLPEQIGNAILYYANPQPRPDHELAMLINISVIVASDTVNKVSEEDWGVLLEDELLGYFGLERDDLSSQLEQWENLVSSIKEMVS